MKQNEKDPGEYWGPTKNDARSMRDWAWLGFKIAVMLLVLAAIWNWLVTPLLLTSPQRLESLSRQANDNWQALEAQRHSIEQVQRRANDIVLLYGEDQSTWPQGKDEEYLQLKQQASNLTIAYNNACGQYKAMWQDEWRSIPAPNDLPTTCDMIGPR